MFWHRCGKMGTLYTVGEIINWYRHMVNSMDVPQEIKKYDIVIPLLSIYSKEIKSLSRTPMFIFYINEDIKTI